MNTLSSKLLISGLFFVFIFLFGFWLRRTVKPYPSILLNFHKLIGLAAGIYLVVSVYRYAKVTPLSPTEMIILVITVLLFLIMVVTGGLVSIDKPMPAIISLSHKVLPYLTVISTGVTIYLIFT